MEAGVARSIHVAGVISLAEAELLIGCGIRYSEFPLVLDHHDENLTIDAAAENARTALEPTVAVAPYCPASGTLGRKR